MPNILQCRSDIIHSIECLPLLKKKFFTKKIHTHNSKNAKLSLEQNRIFNYKLFDSPIYVEKSLTPNLGGPIRLPFFLFHNGHIQWFFQTKIFLSKLSELPLGLLFLGLHSS